MSFALPGKKKVLNNAGRSLDNKLQKQNFFSKVAPASVKGHKLNKKAILGAAQLQIVSIRDEGSASEENGVCRLGPATPPSAVTTNLPLPEK